VRQYCPKIVFISETRQQRDRVSNLRHKTDFKNAFVVDGQGKGGGLGLFWDDEIKLQVLSYGMHHIDTVISDADHHASWRATFVYGEPRMQDRHVMWELLKRIKPVSKAPWLLIGDFNEAMWSFEHFSGRRRPKKQMSDFREALAHCAVHDIGFSGMPWAFDNKQSRDRNVKVLLDRVVASASWLGWFPGVQLHRLVMSRSDHLRILLEIDQDTSGRQSRRISCYEIMWE
jgi:hypothetical protein